jgi:hypothetical protein
VTDLPPLGDAPHYTTVRTLLMDAEDNSRQLAWIDGAIWPPQGAVVELYEPNRDATVTHSRLALAPDGSATVLVYVKVPEADQFEPK